MDSVTFTVRVTRDISDSGQMQVMADSATVGADGSLIFIGHNQQQKYQGVIIPPGSWKLCYQPEMVAGMVAEEEGED